MSRRAILIISLVVAVLALGGLVLHQKSRAPKFLTAPLPGTVYMEDMTWVELREAIRTGYTTVIVPTGGTEQNGPHGVLGKHNFIVRQAAGEIAAKLGKTVVAPVIKYVPEGDIDSREGHMAFPGTLSVPEEVFAAVLEATARSLKAHGFKLIAFIGDSGGNQAAQRHVADKLTQDWLADGVRVVHVERYYDAEQNGGMAYLLRQGESRESIGRHMGIRDTSELMAVYPEGVRMDRLEQAVGSYHEPTGVDGDPTRATAARGRKLLDLKVAAAVEDIAKVRKDMQ
jgi:creatinine amidohydrolase